jgi:hypothetical protein
MSDDLVELLRKIDPEGMSAMGLREASTIRPYERFLHAVALSATKLAELDDAGNIVSTKSESLKVYVVTNHPDMPLPTLDHQGEGALVQLGGAGGNPPILRQVELTTGLMAACLEYSSFTPSDMMALNQLYNKLCLANGFKLVTTPPPRDRAKKSRTEPSDEPSPKIDSTAAIDMLMERLQDMMDSQLRHARVSFCFVVPDNVNFITRYAAVSPLQCAPQRVQLSHLMVIVCGSHLYITSTE